MENIYILQDILDKYLQQHKRYKKVKLLVDGQNGIIEWSEPYSDKWWHFERKQFPIEDIEKLINNYKYKLKQ
jgi:hypothetical protein